MKIIQPRFLFSLACAAALLSCAVRAFAAPAAGVTQNGLDDTRPLMHEKAAWTPAQSKMESQLIHAMKSNRGQAFAAKAKNVQTDVALQPDGRVLVDIKANVTPRLLALIQQGGGVVVNSFPKFRAIRAAVTLRQMETLAGSADVSFIRRAEKAHTRTGAVDSQGDATHRAALARAVFGTTGAGVKVGVLSDSADYLGNSQAAGELDAVTVLPGQAGNGPGEGTAMLEVMHDLAPGAQLYFATAMNGPGSFAQNILDLRAAGCNVIVDDVGYPSESPFQDDIIAQAVNTVTSSGALYFSAAGNSGSQKYGTSGTW